MGRHRGPKFSFPLPGRKSHAKVGKNNDELSSVPSISSISSVPEWPPRRDDSSSYSKAHRVLGTAGPPFRPSSGQANVPPNPGYMTITVSEPVSDFDDKDSSIAMDDANFMAPRRPNMSNRASSNILPANMMYNGDERQGSNCSSVSRHLHPRASNSTMRSHYDAQSSPLAISQQTSDSAVRDMALRKGKPQIGTHNFDHARSPLAHEFPEGSKKEHRKRMPPRLDLSKLFPKPKGHRGQEYAGLLSPNKLVNSPTAMSTASDYFPRPMTREPTPTLKGHAKLTKPSQRQQVPSTQPQRSPSLPQLYKRDTYDSAKKNVRRPPRGIQHWFEGLDEDSDELEEDEPTPVHAPTPVNPSGQHLAPVRKSSLGRLLHDTGTPKAQGSCASQHIPDPRKGHYLYPKSSAAHQRLTSPSQFSLQSQSSLATTKTKESAFSKKILQDSSVLSFSSSEDEEEHVAPARRKVSVRDSIDMTDHGDIIIGQAQVLEVRPHAGRRPSAGKLSLLSTSTNAATIEVVYTPEPYTAQHFPRNFSSSRRSSHMRQPSVIPEVEDVRPKTAANRPMSPSSHSVRTSMSEPRSREAQKFMAVTAEEEALLEALRKKRAAMAQQSFAEGYVTAIKQEDVRQKTPPEQTNKKAYRTSAFLSIESPSASPVRVIETKKPGRKAFTPTPAPLLVPPSRGRSVSTAQDSGTGTSILRDSSSCDPGADRQSYPSNQAVLAHQLSPPPEFSPLNPFPFPTPTASVASPTTVSHSPLPSPVTPRLRHGEVDIDVKVASSEPSCNGGDDEVAVLETGIIGPPSGSIKPDGMHGTHHQRRRTASSGADVPIPFSPEPNPRNSQSLAPVSETSSRPTSVVDPILPQPKLPRKSSKRQSSLSVSTTGLPKSRHNSIVSNHTSSPVLSHYDRRTSRAMSRVSSIGSMKRESVILGAASTRCSVSEDVLAAWGSLGGLRDYDTARY